MTRWPVTAVSSLLFNTSGRALVCPVVLAAEGPLHIRPTNVPCEGCVLCEQVRYADLTARGWTRLGSASCYEVMDVSDAVMGSLMIRMGEKEAAVPIVPL
ncbi:MAG: hypothetical protein IKP40_11135 [Clostridia bacterium]|nr:hypothetical protein [Clostridia bacterium]